MTQTEQKVRTRDEQVIVISTMLMALAESKAANGDPEAAMETAERHILEAEARGAAEQRRKDVEGLEPFAYVSQIDANTPKNVQGLEQFGEYCDKKYDYFQVPLYTHPANVAALEARVRELEGVLRKADEFITNGIEFGYIRMPDADTPDTALETPGIIRAALKREGGV